MVFRNLMPYKSLRNTKKKKISDRMRQHSGALCRTLKTDICRDLNGVGNLRYSRGRAVSRVTIKCVTKPDPHSS